MNKFSHIEPNVFKGFAREMMDAAARETPNELDEMDPNSPYRDSALQKALGTDRTRPGQAEVPRGDFSRPNPSAKTAGSPLIARLIAAHTGRRFQEELEGRTTQKSHKHIGPKEKIPGSYLLAHEGIAYATPSAGAKKWLQRNADPGFERWGSPLDRSDQKDWNEEWKK
jgi:hypothetical protein